MNTALPSASRGTLTGHPRISLSTAPAHVLFPTLTLEVY